MGYIGSQPATNFETVRKQVSTTNSGTTITLDYSVSSVQDILVTVNAVVQSYDNYSVSGTTLTLGGTLNNDRVEILYVGRTFQTVTPDTGTVTNDMLAGSIANSKLANSSISINGSSVSLGGSLTGIGGANTPMFAVRRTTGQSITDNTYVKVQFATEDIDTDSAYDNSTNYRFTVPSGKAGKYLFSFNVAVASSTGVSNAQQLFVALYKNGSSFIQNFFDGRNNAYGDTFSGSASFILDCAVSDYFEVYARFNDGGGSTGNVQSSAASFSGVRLIT